MPDPNEIAKLEMIATRLLARTKMNRCQWQPTADDLTFQLPMEDHAILIQKEGPFITMSIRDSAARTISSLEVLAHVPASAIISPEMNRSTILNELHDAAKKSAFRIDETLDDILRSI